MPGREHQPIFEQVIFSSRGLVTCYLVPSIFVYSHPNTLSILFPAPQLYVKVKDEILMKLHLVLPRLSHLCTRTYIFLCASIFLFSPFLRAGTDSVDIWIDQFKNTSGEKQKAVLDKLAITLRIQKNDAATLGMNKLLKLSESYTSGSRADIRALILLYSYDFVPVEQKIHRLTTAYLFAKEHDNLDVMARAKASLSDEYRYFYRYDSAMVCLLEAQRLFEQDGNIEENVAILHRLGDFYFWANIFDKAESVYHRVLYLKGEKRAWESFRYPVILNNLGFIHFNRGQYKRADEFYQTSLDFINRRRNVFNRDDSVRLAYTYFLLSLNSFSMNKYEFSSAYTDSSMKYTLAANYTTNLPDLYLSRARLLRVKNQPKEALEYLLKVKTFFPEPEVSDSYLEMCDELAKIYGMLNNWKESAFWERQLSAWSDTLDQMVNAAAFLQIKAEADDLRNQEHIAFLEKRETTILIVSAVLLIMLVIIAFIQHKRRKSDRKLIEKTLALMNLEVHAPPQFSADPPPDDDRVSGDSPSGENTGSEAENASEEAQQDNYSKLTARMESILFEEKLFLEPGLTLDDLAAKLDTNRTYLSKAINEVYKTNFTNYINEARIKESIRLIYSGNPGNMTVEGIGREVGFNNRGTFISAFKKFTGLTPSYFSKNLPAVSSDS